MTITRDDVERLGRMTRIDLTDEEAESLAADMATILEHVERLQSVDTSSVSVETHITGLQHVTRADEVGQSLPVEAVLANAPARSGDFFEVPAVLGS